MPTNKQRRDAARRHLERQLERRQEREIRRRKLTLVGSIVGTLVIIAVIVIVFTALGGSDNKKTPTAGTSKTSTSPTPTPSVSTTPAPLPTKACEPSTAAVAHFGGLTITGATDVKHEPKVSGKSAAAPTTLSCMDLVVGKGAAATATSQATVEYVGVVYATGKVFQSSWSTAPATFSVAPGKVITGFNQGIVGAGKVAPMHVGGRRLIIIPAALAYGANPPSGSGIPANATLVFVVDLQKLA